MAGRKTDKSNSTYYILQNKTDKAGIRFDSYNDVLEYFKKYKADNTYKLIKCIDIPVPTVSQYNKNKDTNNKSFDEKDDSCSINNIISYLAYKLSGNKLNLEHNIEVVNPVKSAIHNMPDVKSFDKNCREIVRYDDRVKTIGEYYFYHFILSSFLIETDTQKNTTLYKVLSDSQTPAFMFIIDCAKSSNNNFKYIIDMYLSIYISRDKMIIGTPYTLNGLYKYNKEITCVDEQTRDLLKSYIDNILRGI